MNLYLSKRKTKSVIAFLLGVMFLWPTFKTGVYADVSGDDMYAPTPYEGTFDAFVMVIGDAYAADDWGAQYMGRRNPGNTDNVIKAVDGREEVSGEQFVLSVQFDVPVIHTWVMVPCLCLYDTKIDCEASSAEIKVFIDGEEITDTVDFDAGPVIWAEAGGKGGTYRLAGGYDEWATQYIKESPTGFCQVRYEITVDLWVDNRPEEVIFNEEAEEAVSPEEVKTMAVEEITGPIDISANMPTEEINEPDVKEDGFWRLRGTRQWVFIGAGFLILIGVIIKCTSIKGSRQRKDNEA